MNVEILPEPSDEEREAILAALAAENETAEAGTPWQEASPEP